MALQSKDYAALDRAIENKSAYAVRDLLFKFLRKDEHFIDEKDLTALKKPEQYREKDCIEIFDYVTKNDPEAKAWLLKCLNPFLMETALKKQWFDLFDRLLDLDTKGDNLKQCSDETLYELLSRAYRKTQKGQERIFKAIDKGMDINRPNLKNGYPLLSLSLLPAGELFFKLVDKYKGKINFNVRDRLNSTPLHYAVKDVKKNRRIIQTLLKNGADPQAKDMFGMTPYDWAIKNGDVTAAMILSNKSKEEIMQDKNFNTKMDQIDNKEMTFGLFHYLKIKNYEGSGKKPLKQVKGEKISEIVEKLESESFIKSAGWEPTLLIGGICKGWSFLAALEASKSDNELVEFYKKSALLSSWFREGWYKDPRSLFNPDLIPAELKNKYSNLDKLFKELKEEIYWFFQQGETNFGLSLNDRKRQLKIIFGEEIEESADFGLKDLTLEEEKQVLEAFDPILKETVIDAFNQLHAVALFQNVQGKVRYFDPNIPFLLKKYNNFREAIDATDSAILPTSIKGFHFFHTKPEKLTFKLRDKADKISRDLIDVLIINNPNRMETYNLQTILNNTAENDMSHMLRNLLSHPTLSLIFNDMKPPPFQSAFVDALKAGAFESVYVLYTTGKVNFEKLDADQLENLLRSGNLHEDAGLIKIAEERLSKLNLEEAETNYVLYKSGKINVEKLHPDKDPDIIEALWRSGHLHKDAELIKLAEERMSKLKIDKAVDKARQTKSILSFDYKGMHKESKKENKLSQEEDRIRSKMDKNPNI